MANTNPIVGHITCPFCQSQKCPVRENKNGRLYYSCRLCGPSNFHGDSFQDAMQDLMVPVEPAGDPAPPPPAASEAKPAKKKKAKPAEPPPAAAGDPGEDDAREPWRMF